MENEVSLTKSQAELVPCSGKGPFDVHHLFVCWKELIKFLIMCKVCKGYVTLKVCPGRSVSFLAILTLEITRNSACTMLRAEILLNHILLLHSGFKKNQEPHIE